MSGPPRPAPERLFFNGRIRTMRPEKPCVRVLAVRGGRIVYAGDDADEGAARLSPGAERLDLGGHTAMPGFIDTHLHFKTQGQQLSEPDIALKSKEEILRLVREEAGRLAPGEWIQGRGWNNELWEDKNWPRRAELDAVAPEHPVALTRSDAHSMWVNSKALEAAGIRRDDPDPPGGEILRDERGEPLGILVDTPIFQVWAAVPPLTAAQTLAAWQKAQAELFRHGITSAGDAWQTLDDHENLKKAYAQGEIAVRLYGMLASVDHADRPCFPEGRAPLRGLFDQRLSLAAFKVVLDGSLGSRSAWLRAGYRDRPGHSGKGRYDDRQLAALLRPALDNGFQICAHAIGDAAVRQGLKALAAAPVSGVRHRIEHFQIATPDDIAEALALGVIPAMQTVHCAADRKMAEARLGPASLEHAYPWRRIIDSGGIIANGSDSPMESVNPFLGLHAALARTPFACRGGDAERLRLSREEALKSYTVWAAEAEGASGLKGALGEGMLADLIVLDRDPVRCPVEELPETRVLLTVLGGETVFSR